MTVLPALDVLNSSVVPWNFIVPKCCRSLPKLSHACQPHSFDSHNTMMTFVRKTTISGTIETLDQYVMSYSFETSLGLQTKSLNSATQLLRHDDPRERSAYLSVISCILYMTHLMNKNQSASADGFARTCLADLNLWIDLDSRHIVDIRSLDFKRLLYYVVTY
jgi:hypothetical protein